MEKSENMARVKELMRNHQQMEVADTVNAGGAFQEGVPVDFTSKYGTEVKGTVVFKRPTIFERMQIGAGKSEILRRSGVRDPRLLDDSFVYLAEIIATLSVVLVSLPTNLNISTDDLESVQETDILLYLYGEYELWDLSFQKDAGQVPDARPSESTDRAENVGP